jgi:predicted membrane protein
MDIATLKHLYIKSKAQKGPGLLRLPSVKLNWNILCFAGLIMIMFLLFFYVYSINELTRGAYFIKNYERQTDALLQKNKNLEVGFAKSGFLGNLEIKTKELVFEKVKEVKYIQIQISDNSFAAVK